MDSSSPRDWLEKADSCRERADLYRIVIERAEGPGGRASHPRWPEVKAILLEMAEDLEREAMEAEARAAEA